MKRLVPLIITLAALALPGCSAAQAAGCGTRSQRISEAQVERYRVTETGTTCSTALAVATKLERGGGVPHGRVNPATGKATVTVNGWTCNRVCTRGHAVIRLVHLTWLENCIIEREHESTYERPAPLYPPREWCEQHEG